MDERAFLEKNSDEPCDNPKEFKTRTECRRQRTRTEKGIEMDLEVATKKRNKAANALKTRIKETYEALRWPQDITKLQTFQDGLELDLARVNTLQDDFIDLSIKLERDSENDERQFKELINPALECLAEVKIKLKDLEFERMELLSQKSSLHGGGSTRCLSSATKPINHGALRSATLKDKMMGLKKQQEIDRRREDLERRRRELEREFEEIKLESELSNAELIEKIIREPTCTVPENAVNQELEQTPFPVTKDKQIQDPWDITELSQLTPTRDGADPVDRVKNTVTQFTGSHKLQFSLDTGNPKESDTRKPEREVGKEPKIFTDNEGPSKIMSSTGIPGTSKNTVRRELSHISTDTGSPKTQRNVNVPLEPHTPLISNERQSSLPFRQDANAPIFVPQQPSSTPPFVPAQLTPYSLYPSQLDMSLQFQSISRENAEIQRQQVSLLKRLMLPAPKPPIFEGDILDYPKWESAFDALIEEDGDPTRKLYYLGQYTSGAAQKTITGLLGLRTENAYSRARKLLKERYGNPFKIYDEYRKRLIDWPTCKSGADMLQLSDFLITTQETMKTVGYLKELNSLSFIRLLATRLPPYYCNRWRRSAKKIEDEKNEYTFDDLVEFVQSAASDATHPVFSQESLSAVKGELERNKMKITYPAWRGATRYDNKRPQGSTFATSVLNGDTTEGEMSTGTGHMCPLCNKPHELEHCKTFLGKSPNERVEICKSKGICFSCLSRGHMVRQCRKKSACEVCNKSHATLLHYDRQDDKISESVEEWPKATTSCTSVCNLNDCNGTTSSMIVPVLLHNKENPSHKVHVYAVLDDQSDTCFVTNSVCKELKLTGPEITLQLGTMHSVQNVKTNKIEGLVVSRVDGDVSIPLPRVYSRYQIPARREQIPRPETAWNWEHLRPIAKKIPPYRDEIKIGVLIGNNCVRAIKPRQVIPGKASDPYAIRTVLGWGIIGAATGATAPGHRTNYASCCKTVTRTINEEGNQGHFVHPTTHKEVMTPLAVKKMFEHEFSDTQNNEKPFSQEDVKFLNMMKEGIHKTDDGHYEMPLPLREENVSLPSNRKYAEMRLMQLKARFDRDNQYKEDYASFMRDMFEKGYAEEAPAGNERAWYIPHHGVYHPKKPGKIRVVFDCSAKSNGRSLNQHLLQGPDLTSSLTGVLCRFRQEPICFACDIEGMFCQVRVNEEHRDYLRFLFWENGDTSTTPNEYRMRVHLFGATSSPGCANFALKTTAQENRCDSEMAARFLTKNFYVDDGLMSSSTVTEAVSTVKEAREMCAKGGFKLHKFISNSKEVLEAIPAEERAKGVKDLDLDLDPLPMERVLGVEWCAERDSFKFKISLKNKPVTRRGILSIVSSIYDPLGLAAPLLLRGKRILQHLCKEGIEWDDPVPDELRTRWDLWKKELPLLDEMEVRRCFKPEGFAEVKNAELHHFSDASTEGYGQCSYVRLVDINDRIHCSLVMGKARVAPLKPVTIPRLELTAALVSARASQVIKKELDYSISDEIFWTDSKVVKGYVQNDARRFHTYVANRVQQIRDLTLPGKWLYVDSKNNPADDASRGLDVRELLQQGSRWLHGPEFLWKHCDRWTDQENVKDQPLIPTDDKELKKASSFATVTNKFPSLLERLQYFSDWFRMVRALALCLRYIQILADKVRFRNSSRTNNNVLQSTPHRTVNVEELKVAERKIIAEVQQDTFSDEISTLQRLDVKQEIGREQARQRNQEMKNTSQLYRLDPFLDAKGIIRVGGRIKQASISENVKHPAILPRHSHVTQLLIKYFHTKTDHQGRGYTVNEIRSSGFWIMSCSTAVAEFIQKCTTCRKLRAKVQEQKMADLPADRLEECPPFTYCGVDYFGPWHVKEGRKELKRYGVLFTCMSSRAIHLEVAQSLETDSFINAFRRFVCRRGPVRQLRSDQGTNFIGARRELKEALLEMDQTKVAAEMLKFNCDWVDVKFNVPSASHMGGVWERQIRSVRSVLSSLLENNGTQLNDEALRTFMCEAEAVVNSRPLTTDNLMSTDSVEPLTPNHLLTMKTKVVLPPPGVFQRADMYSRKRWRRVQHLTNEFWCRWRKEFLHSMQERRKWTRPRRNLEVDDLVIIKDDAPRNQWRLARVSEVYVDDDGLVRKVKLAVGSTDLSTQGKRKAPLTTLDRPVQKLVLLLPRSAMERPGVPDEEPYVVKWT